MPPVKLILATLVLALTPSLSKAETPRELSEALFLAAHLGHMPSIVDLVQRGANVNYANANRETPMHAAAARGHLNVIQFLMSRRAHMNPRTVQNWIPLHHAVRFGHVPVVHYLLSRRAPIYSRTRGGQTVFDIAKSTRNQQMINLLERYRR
jgi:ankyrin repeat protein